MKKIFCIIILSSIVINIHSQQSIYDIVPNITESDYAKLLGGGDLARSATDYSILYLPEFDGAESIVAYNTDNQPGILIEALFLIPMDMSNFEDKSEFMLNTASMMSALSTQEGLTYYSSTRDREMVLIQKSFFVEEMNSRNPIADPEVSALPINRADFAFQKDSTFGSNYYLYMTNVDEERVFISNLNQTRLKALGIMQIADINEVNMNFVAIPAAEGLIVYSIAFVQNPPTQKKIMGIAVDIKGFFLKRIRVIVNHYRTQIDEYF